MESLVYPGLPPGRDAFSFAGNLRKKEHDSRKIAEDATDLFVLDLRNWSEITCADRAGLYYRLFSERFRKTVHSLLFTAPSQTFENLAARGSTAAVAADFLMCGRFLLRRQDSDKEKISYRQA